MRLRDAHSPELAEAFRLRAHDAMRRDPREALALVRLALVVARTVGEAEGIAAVLRSLAQAAILSGRYPTALRAIKAAARRPASPLGRAELEAIRVQALTHLERYEEARETAEPLVEVFRDAADHKGEIRTRLAIGDLEFRLDRPRAALRQYNAVDRLIPADAPDRLRAVIAGNRGIALEAVNRFRAATRHFTFAREVFSAAGFDQTAAQVEYNAAYADFLRGRHEDALRRFAALEPEFDRLGDERHLAHLNLDRAELHLHLNMPEEAEVLAGKAEERFVRLGLVKESAEAALLAGRSARFQGDRERAAAEIRRAEERFLRLGLDERRLGCVVQRAALAGGEEARRLLAEAKGLVTDDTSPLRSAAVDLLGARLDLAQGDTAGARTRAERVIDRFRRIHAPWVEIEARRALGRCEALDGRRGDAVREYRRAIEALESYRGGVPPDEYMASFLAGRSGLYEEIVTLLVELGEADEAFAFAQRAKSRALVDLLSAGADERSAGPELTSKRLAHLRERLNAVYRRLFKKTGETGSRSVRAVRRVQAQASELEAEVARLLRESQITNREAASLMAVEAPDVGAIRRSLEDDETLIEYFLAGESLYTFVLLPDGIQVVRQEVTEEEIRQLLLRFHFHLSKHSRPVVPAPEHLLEATRANLTKLAALLIGPVADLLTGRRIVVAPHGILHQAPFHALPYGDGWLCDEFEVTYTPSASVYGFCRSRGACAKGAASVFGLPDELAPRIEDEVERVAGILGTDRVHLGDDATLSAFREEARRARILHIATHGMFRHARPMLSSIRLADGWMNLYDLYGLDFRGELVVLSTCESGTADVTDGDEVLGLTRGFLYAGAPALLTSQWRVHDAVTSDFMIRFYTHLDGERDAAAALKNAMADIRSRYPHPYYWAPFFLTGRPVVRAGSAGEQRDPGIAPAGGDLVAAACERSTR